MPNLDEIIRIYRDCRDRAPGDCSKCPLRGTTFTGPGVSPTSICTILQVIDSSETAGHKEG